MSTSEATCRIQWVDDHGQPTPDDSPAVGVAHFAGVPLPRGGRSGARSFPICAEHLARMPRGRVLHSSNAKPYKNPWTFEPFEVTP